MKKLILGILFAGSHLAFSEMVVLPERLQKGNLVYWRPRDMFERPIQGTITYSKINLDGRIELAVVTATGRGWKIRTRAQELLTLTEPQGSFTKDEECLLAVTTHEGTQSFRAKIKYAVHDGRYLVHYRKRGGEFVAIANPSLISKKVDRAAEGYPFGAPVYFIAQEMSRDTIYKQVHDMYVLSQVGIFEARPLVCLSGTVRSNFANGYVEITHVHQEKQFHLPVLNFDFWESPVTYTFMSFRAYKSQEECEAALTKVKQAPRLNRI